MAVRNKASQAGGFVSNKVGQARAGVDNFRQKRAARRAAK
jgi:hypothetical protein